MWPKWKYALCERRETKGEAQRPDCSIGQAGFIGCISCIGVFVALVVLVALVVFAVLVVDCSCVVLARLVGELGDMMGTQWGSWGDTNGMRGCLQPELGAGKKSFGFFSAE